MGIRLENVTKTYLSKKDLSVQKKFVRNFFFPEYVKKVAVDHISLNIPKGYITGLIGTNGAGKSTVIKMMTGILAPDEGEIYIQGLNIKKYRKRIMGKICVVFGQRSQLCWDIPVIDTLKLFKEMYRVPENVYQKNLEMFLEFLDLKEVIYKPPRLLSLGERMKADLAAALLHDPEVIFLDEPTIGIDILAKSRIREFLKIYNRENKNTIVLTSHDLGDVEALCKDMIIMDHGKIIYNGKLQALFDEYKIGATGEENLNPAIERNLEIVIKNIYEGRMV